MLLSYLHYVVRSITNKSNLLITNYLNTDFRIIFVMDTGSLEVLYAISLGLFTLYRALMSTYKFIILYFIILLHCIVQRDLQVMLPSACSSIVDLSLSYV
jgi:hypothetical protein